MHILDQYLTPSTLIKVTVLLLILTYLFPFLVSKWITFTRSIWGVWLASRKKKAILKIFPINPKILSEKPADIQKFDNKVKAITKKIEDAIGKEIGRSNEFHKKEINRLQEELHTIDTSLKKINEQVQAWPKKAQESFIGKTLISLGGAFNGKTVKDLFLLLGIWTVIVIDALIATHIIESLGLFVEEKLEIFGKTIPHGYPLLMGSFITVSLAIFLHIILKREFLRNWINKPRIGFFISIAALSILSLFLLLMVFLPDSAKVWLEAILRIAWLMGVIIVYWFIGEIVGDGADYLFVFIPLSIGFILILCIIFGTAFILELLVGQIWNILAFCFFQLRKARVQKRKHNLMMSDEYFKKGLWRGAA